MDCFWSISMVLSCSRSFLTVYYIVYLSYNLNLPVSIQIVLLQWVKSFHLQYQESVQAVSPIILSSSLFCEVTFLQPRELTRNNFLPLLGNFQGHKEQAQEKTGSGFHHCLNLVPVVPWRYAQSPICQLHIVMLATSQLGTTFRVCPYED